jgi:radial spoke head protein 3
MAEENVRRDISTPEPVEGRQNIDIQTDVRVEEITDKPPEYEIGVQSDFYIDRPVRNYKC